MPNQIYRPNKEQTPRQARQIRNMTIASAVYETTVTDTDGATTIVTVVHTLGRIPTNFRIVYKNNSGVIHATGTWTKNIAYFTVPGSGDSNYWKVELY